MTAPAPALSPSNGPALSPSNGPHSVLLLKTDTLGDLVLFAPALRALREAWPQARLTVIIRHAYRDLAPALASNIEWLTTTIDPFADAPQRESAELSRLRDAVAALAPDLVAAATSRHNWLDAALAASARTAARRIVLGDGAPDEIFSTRLRVQLGLDASTAFAEAVPCPVDEPDCGIL